MSCVSAFANANAPSSKFPRFCVVFIIIFFLFLSEDVQWMRMLSYTIVTLLFALSSIFKCLEAYC